MIMAQPTVEQRLEAAEYKIDVLAELLYRLVDNEALMRLFGTHNDHVLNKIRSHNLPLDQDSINKINKILCTSNKYFFNPKLGDANE